MAIVETKSTIASKEGEGRKAGFDNFFWSPAKGFAWGICVLWKEFQFHHISIEPIMIEERFMIFKYQNPEIDALCALVFIYAPPHESGKETFWSKFSKCIMDLELPCIILWDHNEIQKVDKKKVALPQAITDSRDWFGSKTPANYAISQRLGTRSHGGKTKRKVITSMKDWIKPLSTHTFLRVFRTYAQRAMQFHPSTTTPLL